MYIHSAKLINFKSMGDYPETEVILEPKVTAIIGKNESGKSNVLDGLSRIDFLRNNPAAFAADVINRNSAIGTENAYEFTLKPSEEEIGKGLIEDTTITVTKNRCAVKGSFFKYYKEKVFPHVNSFLEIVGTLGNNPFQCSEPELTKFKTFRRELLVEEEVDSQRFITFLDYFGAKATKIPSEKRETYIESIDLAKKEWETIIKMLPVFFVRRKDKHLDTLYKFDDIKKELERSASYPNSLLTNFVSVIGISIGDFILASQSGSLPGQESMRRKINRLVEEKINEPFYDFYKTEKIKLDLGFNSGNVSFVVQSEDGEALMLSERSDGLRWYLELFIDAQANNFIGRNTVYLFDEPGVSLHVNAQRELKKLFHHLSEKGNQIVYTTHSPYMLDLEEDGIHRIRAVVKNVEGFTHVYKTAYDSRISPDSQEDTLAPIISAIGMNLNDTFGPAKDKINIVTEGMSDYIYLCTAAKVLNIDTEKYAIIPSVGASNCIKICSILHGWGCRYMALFDYDSAGVQTGGEYLRKEMLFECKKHFCYLIDVDQKDIDEKTYKDNPYVIEDVITKSEIERFCEETNTPNSTSKPLMAKLISNAIDKGSFEFSEMSKQNFQNLFDRIFSYFT